MTKSNQQLPLPLNLTVETSFDNYYVPEDSANLQVLRMLVGVVQGQGQGEPVVMIWGATGVGLTHILQACTRLAQASGRSARFWSLTDSLQPDIEDLAGVQLLCVDDVHLVAGKPDLQEELFDTFNRLRDQGSQMIFASHLAPQGLVVELADLRSRLLSGPVYQMQPLDDQDKVRVLQLQADRLGLQLSEEVAVYLVNHSPRNLGDLIKLLGRLDTESLAQQRRLTIPFIKPFLAN